MISSKIFARLCATIFVHILLPTIDTVSDVYLALKATNNGYPDYGIALLTPVIINTIFATVAFVRFEENRKWTWPLVILQIWPQYRTARILHVVLAKDTVIGNQMLTDFKENVAPLEPFLEALPQIYIKVYMWVHLPREPIDKVSKSMRIQLFLVVS